MDDTFSDGTEPDSASCCTDDGDTAKASTWTSLTRNSAGHVLAYVRYVQSMPGRLSRCNAAQGVAGVFHHVKTMTARGLRPSWSHLEAEKGLGPPYCGGVCRCRCPPDFLEPMGCMGQMPVCPVHGQDGGHEVPFTPLDAKDVKVLAFETLETHVDAPTCPAPKRTGWLTTEAEDRSRYLRLSKRRPVDKTPAWHQQTTAVLGFLSISVLAMSLLYMMYSILGLAGLFSAPTWAVSVPMRTRTPIATVKNGTYVGVYSPQYKQDFFLGMPYAQKPVRFANSQHLNSSWLGTREATKYPLHCVGYGPDMEGYESSEDCLYLNVIRPTGVSPAAQLPVAVWIHGGGLIMGGTADKRYNMSFLVERSVQLGTPIIGVSMNYRLSAFGFPWGKEALEAGVANLGFKDQRLALRWVNENIGAFGGCKTKVTIFGESSGAESTSIQTYAYNGRDDKLFRAVMGESGFAGPLMRLAGGLNATAAQQNIYDDLVTNTSCASTVGTPASLDCLRALSLPELNATLNRSITLWGPVLDGDLIANYPSVQLREGKFPKIPLLLGCNSDEGTSMHFGRPKPNTDDEMRVDMNRILPANAQATSGKTVSQLTDELFDAYPNDQAVGIPGLDKFPMITNGSDLADMLGMQYRRAAAIFGDYAMQYTRRRTAIAWSNHNVPSWSYRFDVLVNGIPAYVGATHFMEVAFVFYNLAGDGYPENPFANATADYIAVARTMADAWINFVATLNPNGAGAGLALPGGETWVPYNASAGRVGENLVFAVNGSHLEKDDWRSAGMSWMDAHSLSVFGN